MRTKRHVMGGRYLAYHRQLPLVTNLSSAVVAYVISPSRRTSDEEFGVPSMGTPKHPEGGVYLAQQRPSTPAPVPMRYPPVRSGGMHATKGVVAIAALIHQMPCYPPTDSATPAIHHVVVLVTSPLLPYRSKERGLRFTGICIFSSDIGLSAASNATKALWKNQLVGVFGEQSPILPRAFDPRHPCSTTHRSANLPRFAER